MAAERELAARAFDEATVRVKGHPLAMAARLAFVERRVPSAPSPADAGLLARLSLMRSWGADAEVSVVEALESVANGEHGAAAARVHAALRAAPPGVACWFIPVDPLLQTSTHPSSWEAVLAILRERAA